MNIAITDNYKFSQNRNRSFPSFSSRINPIKPLKYPTSKGEVTIYEPTSKELLSGGLISDIVDFFTENLSKDTKDPGWLALGDKKNKNLISVFKKQFRYEIENLIKNDDGHLTISVAKDKNGKLCAGCMSYGYDEVPMAKNNTLYIENIAVAPEYRKNHLGDMLIKKVIDAEKAHFTDVFLVGENMAAGFYKKLGFKKLNPNNKNQRAIIDFMSELRWTDFPKYVSLFTKPIQQNATRWYDISGPVIRKLFCYIEY